MNLKKLYPEDSQISTRNRHTLSAKLTAEDTELLKSISLQFDRMKELFGVLEGKLTNLKRAVTENGLKLEYLEVFGS